MRWMLWMGVLAGCAAELEVGDPVTRTNGVEARTCDTIEDDVFSELESLRSCSEAAECGQALSGTSCGCTRDLVARNDADPTRFRQLLAEGDAAECGIGFDSVCDCPAAEGFVCEDGLCGWNYVDGAGAGLPACSADAGDPYELTKFGIQGAELVVGVGYSGGCEEHGFRLCWPEQAFFDGDVPVAVLELQHDANGDGCEAWISEDRAFSLEPLADAWQDQVGEGERKVLVKMGDFTEVYVF